MRTVRAPESAVDEEVAVVGQIDRDVGDVAAGGGHRAALEPHRATGRQRHLAVREGGTALEEDHAFLADGNVVAVLADDPDLAHGGVGPSDGALVGEPFGGVAGGEAEALGRAVVFVDDRSPPFDHLLLDLHGAGRGRVNGDLQ